SQGGPGSDGVYSVTVTATDPSGASVDQVFTFTIGNPAPVATDDVAATDEDTPVTIDVLANDTDPDADPLTVTSAVAPNGSVVINGDGTLTYTPNANFNGTDTITYTISDGNGGTSTATVTVTVNPVNDPPVASDDVLATRFNEAVSGNVLDNDSDVDGDPLTVVDFEVDGVTYLAGDTATIPGVGTLLINPDGSFTFTPVTGYSGPVPAVTYTISDGSLTDTAQLQLSDVPRPPQTPPGPPAPPSVTPVLPEESVDTPRNPDWGGNPASGQPGVVTLPIATDPALHVLYAVGSSSTERALAGSSLGAFQASAPLMAEAMGQVPDSLLFGGMTDGNSPTLIRELGRGEVQTVEHSLHVQHAVRHLPVTSDEGLFVQKAVRAAQLESAVRGAVLDAHQSATPGFESLLDPFGLGSPKPAETADRTSQSPVQAPVQADEGKRGVKQAHAVTESTEASVDTSVFIENADVPPQEAQIQPAAAQGFRSQLQRMASDRGVSARPLTRSLISG
ncbi:MAG: tandem-95 repeat protein, partial [Burkholderiales bacterium]